MGSEFSLEKVNKAVRLANKAINQQCSNDSYEDTKFKVAVCCDLLNSTTRPDGEPQHAIAFKESLSLIVRQHKLQAKAVYAFYLFWRGLSNWERNWVVSRLLDITTPITQNWSNRFSAMARKEETE